MAYTCIFDERMQHLCEEALQAYTSHQYFGENSTRILVSKLS
jgi:hypothetical protein